MSAALRPRSLLRAALPSLLFCIPAFAEERALPHFALSEHAGTPAAAARVLFDAPAGEAADAPLWARGEHWKMRFDREGARYFASFGSHLPSGELALSPDRVTVGGEPLEFERIPSVRRAGDRVELLRGSFVEAYALAPERVEQLFVFERLPRAGEIALHIPLDAGIGASERAEGLALATASGEIRYSRAVAVDARGRRFDAPTEVEAEGIVIRVDAASVAAAELPLVIDPFIDQTWLDTFSTDAREPDAVYSTFDLVWLVCFQEAFSATDNDVRVKVMSTAGDVLLDGYADFSAANWSKPRIAYLHANTNCLVVAEVGVSPSRKVFGRTVEPQGAVLLLGAQIQISPNDAGEKFAPTVGGDPSPSLPSSFCVAYQHKAGPTHDTSDIGYALVNGAGIVVVGPAYIPSGSEPRDSSPSLSKSNSAARWTLAFRRVSFSVGISAVYVEWDGTTSSAFGVAGTLTSVIASPSASSPLLDTGRSAVAYERRSSSGSQADVHVAVIEDGVVVASANISALEGSTFQPRDQIRPSIDSDGVHFFVAYSEFQPSFNYYELYGSDVFLSGDTIGLAQAHMEMWLTGLSQLSAHVAAARQDADGPNRFMTVTEVRQNDVNYDISAVQWSTVQGGSWSSYCPGDGTGTACPCGNHGTLGRGCANSSNTTGARLILAGAPSTIADSAVLEASGLVPNQTCLFFQGTLEVADTTFGDGLRCAGGTVVRLGVKTAVGNAAIYPGPGDAPISVLGGIPPEGATRAYQAWYRDPTSFCTPAAFNLSNGVRILWAP